MVYSCFLHERFNSVSLCIFNKVIQIIRSNAEPRMSNENQSLNDPGVRVIHFTSIEKLSTSSVRYRVESCFIRIDLMLKDTGSLVSLVSPLSSIVPDSFEERSLFFSNKLVPRSNMVGIYREYNFQEERTE
jgi:hypothetical protein